MKFVKFFLMICLIVSLISSVSALSVIVKIPDRSVNTVAGERVYFEINVKYPENPSRKDVTLVYQLLNKDGKLISQSENLRAIETQFSLLASMVVPGGIANGLYSVNIIVKVGEEVLGMSNVSFNVVNKKKDYSLIIGWGVLGLILIFLGFKFSIVWRLILIRIKVRRIVRERFRK